MIEAITLFKEVPFQEWFEMKTLRRVAGKFVDRHCFVKEAKEDAQGEIWYATYNDYATIEETVRYNGDLITIQKLNKGDVESMFKFVPRVA